MQILRRSAVATLAAATLALAPVAAADASPHRGTTHAAHAAGARSHASAVLVRVVLKEIKVKDRALVRLAASRAVTRLPDAQESVLVAAIAVDRAALTALGEAVTAGTTTAKQARTALRGYRVENYLKALALLRSAAALARLAGDVPEVVAVVEAAVAAALEITATSARSVLRAAHDALEDAWAAYDGDDD